jgi:magnesium-transporting ATPase (P-type)
MELIILVIFMAFIVMPVVALAEQGSPDEILKAPLDSGLPVPTEDLQQTIFPSIVKMALTLVGTVTFIVFVYSGVMLLIAGSNEEQITKFKSALVWSGVGLAIIMGSYAIVTGVFRLDFT